MASYAFRLNGRGVSADSWDPAQPLLYVLRNQFGLRGAKFGCGLGQCGACTVLMDGRAVRSCQTRVDRASGRSITTIEGLADGALHRVQTAFVAEQAAQCGYCTSGMIMTGQSILNANPRATREQIAAGLERNFCRCGAHARIIEAIASASKAPTVGGGK